jgi:hypothetical protein
MYSIHKNLIIPTMKRFKFITIFSFFFKAVKSQGTPVYDPKLPVYDFFINTIIPLVILSVFFIGVRNRITKHIIKLLDDFLFFGLFIFLPSIYYYKVVKKTGIEIDNNTFTITIIGCVASGLILYLITFCMTLRRHSLHSKLIIGVVYFIVMFSITLLLYILLTKENAKCYIVYPRDLCELSGKLMMGSTVANIIITVVIGSCAILHRIIGRKCLHWMFLGILSVFTAEMVIFGLVFSWFLSDNFYQTKGVLAYVTFCVSRLIDTAIKKDKRTNSVIENIFDVVENEKSEIEV